MSKYIRLVDNVRFLALRRTVEELGRCLGSGGGSGENRGERVLLGEVKKRFGVDVDKSEIGRLYGSKRGVYKISKNADKILGAIFELVKSDERLRAFVVGLPEYSSERPCREIACPGLIVKLVPYQANDAVADLLKRLSALGFSC